MLTDPPDDAADDPPDEVLAFELDEQPLRPIATADLVPCDLNVWRELRGSLERRQAIRTMGRRFRHDPVAYLGSLEDSLINQALPP